MKYTSTRNSSVNVSSSQAITQGISKEGGLFVPESIPKLTADEIAYLEAKSYVQRAEYILSKYLTDFSTDEIRSCAESAYTEERFRSPKIAPLHQVDNGVHILELWHGPTCAFKDMALQILPHLMRVSAKKTADGKTIIILVATSGDTGKAALEGFRDTENTRILVFYPEDGVSPMQKLQMTTQEGKNVAVCAIKGNFDDAQTGVKTIFTDPKIAKKLETNGMMFSSANSINWGRLVPQVVYYISAYCDLISQGNLKNGDPFNVVVPTGNFGNILAAYYAKKMGLPISKLICASNQNRVLTDFIKTGLYDRNRAFHTTTSPSMDILISSNLERLLYDLSNQDDNEIQKLMGQLKEEGRYTVSSNMLNRLHSLFEAGWCDDDQTAETIRDYYNKYRYLLDTHTAVAVHVYEQYRRNTNDTTPAVIASTANPFKFSDSVLRAIGGKCTDLSEFDKVDKLHELTGFEIPTPLATLRHKSKRFSDVCNREDMEQTVYKLLHIGTEG